MIRNLYILILITSVYSAKSQIATEYGTPVKWDRYDSHSKYSMKGIDTISYDSILIDKSRYIRQSKDGDVIEEIKFSNLNKRISCSDEGPKLTGYWTRYYNSGEIKEIGKIVCNQKFGEWLYFYKSGQIKKFEKYEGIDILDSNPNIGYLNGSYLEYHPNGIIKTTGTYKIIEENKEHSILNVETFEKEKECCVWVPKAIKYGEWIEYDSLGILIKSNLYKPSIIDSINLRELTDRYLEININEIGN